LNKLLIIFLYSVAKIGYGFMMGFCSGFCVKKVTTSLSITAQLFPSVAFYDDDKMPYRN
jgi:uncharacterized membrane protein (Fun14 family)